MVMEVKGSVVVITGSAQGIGRAVAEHLLAEGAKVDIMACRHIPTMTKSHHGREMSVMIKVGMCQCQIPTLHGKIQLQQLALVSCSLVPSVKNQNRSKFYNILFFQPTRFFHGKSFYCY